ncbi:MAG: hypothetical protein IKA78_04455 [Oscillospiraceae bacterium]|nr:hypothetical protein [Oscillospiraceae bacterium]
MDDIGQALQEVLADPQKMAELRTIAEGLGLNTLPQETGDTQEGSPAPQLQVSSPAPRQEALLQALLCYLNPPRKSRLERALRVARLSKLAGTALQNYGNLFEAGAL